MFRFLRNLFVIFFIVITAFPVPAQNPVIEPFILPSARFSALGGRHTAMADDFYSIFLNPSAFYGIREEFSAGEFTISSYGPVMELLEPVFSGGDFNLARLAGPGGFAIGFDIGGPLSFGWVGRGLGIGVFSRIKVTASASSVRVRPLAFGDLVISGGYALRLLDRTGHSLDAGFSGKGFFRGLIDFPESNIVEVDELLENPMDQPFISYLGVGLDLGLRYILNNNLTVALVMYDVYSPVFIAPYETTADFFNRESSTGPSSFSTVQRRLDLGVSYRVRSVLMDRYITRFMVMADYRDILDLFSEIPRNPILNLGLGLEVTILNALAFRAGINDALPALGFGLDLSFAKFEFAIYGRELGIDPGIQPVLAMDLSVSFRY